MTEKKIKWMFIGPGTEEKEQSQKEDLLFQNSRFQLDAESLASK